MKIQTLSVKNFLGIKNVEMALDTPVTLIAGKNGSGKSSLQEAIRMAILGKSERVVLKKDYDLLVNDAATANVGVVSITTDCGNGTITVPKGIHGSQIEVFPVLPFVLDSSRFSALKDSERKSFLLGLAGVDMDPKEVEKRLVDRQLDSKKLESITPLLRAGLDTAHKEAKEKATESKGAWRAVTGENYGDKKAEDWQATSPDEVSEGAILQAEQTLELAEKKYSDDQNYLTELKTLKKAHAEHVEQNKTLSERASMLERIQAKLESDEAELAQWNSGIAALQVANGEKCSCPDCGSVLLFYKGELTVFDPSNADEAAKMISYQNSRDLMIRTVENDKRDLAQAEAAKTQLAELGSSPARVPNAAQIEQASETVMTSQAALKEAQNALQAIRNSQKEASSAGDKTGKAAAYHQDVIEWTAIADALAPDGIQNELLLEALEPFNNQLSLNSDSAGWERVSIDGDMVLKFGDRHYNLLSESEKWRVDSIVTLAISLLSGLGVVMFDRFDVLDLPSRSQFITLLVHLTNLDVINTAIVCGTLKSKPQNLPPSITAYWLEDGVFV